MASLATALGLLFPAPTRATQLVVLAIGVAVLALPHGAVDAWHLLGRGGSGRRRVGAIMLYLGLAAFVLAVWALSPHVSLTLFLVLSAWHFGATDALPGANSSVARVVERASAGATPIVASILWAPEETLSLFERLVARSISVPLDRGFASALLWVVFGGWLVARLVGVARALRSRAADSVERVAAEIVTTACFAALPVLLAFGVYFCGAHSIRHSIRVAQKMAPTDATRAKRRFLGWALPTTALTLIAASVGWNLLSTASVDRLLTTIFVGLAALTLPHVALGVPERE